MDSRVRLVARLWFAAVALVVLVGFVLQFWLLFTGGADANSGETGSAAPLGTRFVRLFSFFTIDSNVLVLIAAALLAVRPEREGRFWRLFHLDALLSIVVTGTVFGFLLAPGLQLRDAAVVATALFHYVSPIGFAVGWLVFGPRRRWDWRVALLAFVWPALWLGWTFLHGAITGWYPYPFLDAGELGGGAAVGGALLVVAYAAVVTLVVLAIDRWAPSVGRAPSSRA